MRYKYYLHLLKVHQRTNSIRPLVLTGVSRTSDTYRRLLCYVNFHRFNSEVVIVPRDVDNGFPFSVEDNYLDVSWNFGV